MELEGKVAIATGLGKTVTEGLFRRGASVVVAARHEDQAWMVARRLPTPIRWVRLAERREAAYPVAFLLSDRSVFPTGGFYPADGGHTAQ